MIYASLAIYWTYNSIQMLAVTSMHRLATLYTCWTTNWLLFFLYFAHEFAELLVIFISEVLGTTVLLFMGCLGGVNWGNNMPAFVPGLLFGLTVAMLIQCLGAVSGAHMNPAVTLAAVLMKQLKPMVSVLSQNKCLLSEQMTRTATVKLNFDFHFCF